MGDIFRLVLQTLCAEKAHLWYLPRKKFIGPLSAFRNVRLIGELFSRTLFSPTLTFAVYFNNGFFCSLKDIRYFGSNEFYR